MARHFNLSHHSKQHMTVCGISLNPGSSKSRKTLEKKFIFQIGTLNPTVSSSLVVALWVLNIINPEKEIQISVALRPSGLRTSSQRDTLYALHMTIFAMVVPLYACWLLIQSIFS